MAAFRLLAGLLGPRSNPDRRRGGREVGYAMVRRAPEVIDALRGAIEDAERDPAADEAGFARGTPPVADTPLYAELDPWRPGEPAPAAHVARARAPAPRGGDVRELDTCSDRWLAHAVDEDE